MLCKIGNLIYKELNSKINLADFLLTAVVCYDYYYYYYYLDIRLDDCRNISNGSLERTEEDCGSLI